MQPAPELAALPGEVFTVREVAKIFALPERRLRYWSRTGFVCPSSVQEDGRARYGFRDLIAVRVARDLLAAGVPLRRVRKSLDALRLRLPASQDPLRSLRIRCDHEKLVVEASEGAYEAMTGQLVLDFETKTFVQEVADVLALPVREAMSPEPTTAYDWFRVGCEAEDRMAEGSEAEARTGRDAGRASSTEGDDWAFARAAYEKALELDPRLCPAWTNLGSLLARMGDLEGARDCFDAALACDPDHVEAKLNLCELALRAGDTEVAIEGYRAVLQRPAGLLHEIEAHYGLARALLASGGNGRAMGHLRRFCLGVSKLSSEDRTAEILDRHDQAKQLLARLERTRSDVST